MAEISARRKMTARETAERLGVSVRTVQRIIAEPREDFLNRAQQNRIQAGTLRAQGLAYKEIAEQMGMSIGAVSRLVRDAHRKGEVPELEKVYKPKNAR